MLPSALDGLFGELTPTITPVLPPTLPLSSEPTMFTPQNSFVVSTTNVVDDDDDFADFAGPVALPIPGAVVVSSAALV